MIKKNLILSFLLIMFNHYSCNSDSESRNEAKHTISIQGEVADISFREYEHDFGRVMEGEKVAYVFSFINNGPGNLAITSVSTICGCTVTKYKRDPVAPGKGGTLEVVFDTSARKGVQTKTVSVSSNSKTPVVILKITAEVISN